MLLLQYATDDALTAFVPDAMYPKNYHEMHQGNDLNTYGDLGGSNASTFEQENPTKKRRLLIDATTQVLEP